MANQFQTVFKRTASAALMRMYGETVLYYPSGSKTPIERTAMVVRNQLSVYQELGQQVGPSIICSFLDDAANGILATQINVEADKIEVSMEANMPASKRQVAQLLTSNAGLTRVLVQ
jgi:hypothetical protein